MEQTGKEIADYTLSLIGLIDQGRLMKTTTESKGWEIYASRLKERFDNAYNKLRKASKTEGTLQKIQGALDAIEEIMDLPKEIIHEGEIAENDLKAKEVEEKE